mmetsp:Transcript_27870/g.20890  ORF Transcript_27870/g.20890 Transcript_27870/m.20890 type:complete len:96 (-) Transcript_27870:380-667(-)
MDPQEKTQTMTTSTIIQTRSMISASKTTYYTIKVPDTKISKLIQLKKPYKNKLLQIKGHLRFPTDEIRIVLQLIPSFPTIMILAPLIDNDLTKIL